MKKIFIKEHKVRIDRYSYKYWMACFVEIIGIAFWTIGLFEIYIMKKDNPAFLLINLGGLFFVIGSFLFCKIVKVK